MSNKVAAEQLCFEGDRRRMTACLICESAENLTVEHIIPQTLWKKFGVDPNADEGGVPKTRATLCRACNAATGKLHQRPEMMAMIDTGAPIIGRTLNHLADWTFWVLLILGLERGSPVIPKARSLLQDRFSRGSDSGGIPRGVRVYTGIATTLESSHIAETSRFSVALVGDPDGLGNRGAAFGSTVQGGQALQAAQSIGLGKLVVLVLPPTQSSGREHEARLDAAATTVGLTRIHPPPGHPTPGLDAHEFDLDAVRNLFVFPPFGEDTTLLPDHFRRLFDTFHQG